MWKIIFFVKLSSPQGGRTRPQYGRTRPRGGHTHPRGGRTRPRGGRTRPHVSILEIILPHDEGIATQSVCGCVGICM